MDILGPYLPQPGGGSQMQGTAYSEGEVLYVLGLTLVVGRWRGTCGRCSGLLKVKLYSMGQCCVWVLLGGRQNPEAFDDLKQGLAYCWQSSWVH